ncbi:MAG TPA: hypothetical protein VFQ76_05495 [Longimicrobiaceae bacterium]|nr:hypothetical protein [Longimicrobiaceae bacterium]
MLHDVIFLQRRFPEHARSIAVVLGALSVSALAAGIGLLLLGQR